MTATTRKHCTTKPRPTSTIFKVAPYVGRTRHFTDFDKAVAFAAKSRTHKVREWTGTAFVTHLITF